MLARVRDIGCGWVLPIMRATSNLGTKVDDEATAKLVETKAPPPCSDLLLDTPQLFREWLKRQGPGFKDSKNRGRKFFFQFLLMTCRPREFYTTCLWALLFILARIFNSIVFSQLMATLGADYDDLIFTWSGDFPILWLSVIIFSVSTISASYTSFHLDNSLKYLAIRVRTVAVYIISSITANDATEASFSNCCTTGEVLSMVGGYTTHIEWGAACFPFILVAPIEVVALIVLSVLQVGWLPALAGLAPLILLFVPLQFFLVLLGKRYVSRVNQKVSERLNVTNDAITANSVVKHLTAEEQLETEAMKIRKEEEKHMVGNALSSSFTLAGQIYFAPFMAFCTMMVQWAEGIATLALSFIASDKIIDYLSAIIDSSDGQGNTNDGKVDQDDSTTLIAYKNVAIGWDTTSEPLLHDLTFSLQREVLIGVSGAIACGKSSLLLGMLGELIVRQGCIYKHSDWDSVAYASQKAWLPSGSVLSNIVFDTPENKNILVDDQEWLDLVINCCGLQTDIDGFENGVLQDVGSDGSSLSGGQKARVALARAVYANAKITILDDVLCALDPALAAKIFEDVIAPGGILHGTGRTVIFVTQNADLLRRCDMVLTVKGNTCIIEKISVEASNEGSKSTRPFVDENAIPADAISEKKPKDSSRAQVQAQLSQRFMESVNLIDVLEQELPVCAPKDNEDDKKDLDFVDKGAFYNLVQLYKSLGWVAFTADICICVGVGIVYFWQYAMQEWLNPELEAEDQVDSFAFEARFLIAIAVMVTIPACVVHFLSFLYGTTRIQQKVFHSVVNSPLSFFTRNPASKVYACVVQDGQEVEYTLSASLGSGFMLLAQIVGTVIITCVTCWYMVFLLIPLGFVYWKLQRYYSSSSVPIKQREASKRAPVLNAINDIIIGMPLVHSFDGRVALMLERLYVHSRLNYAWSMVVAATAGWLAFWSNVMIYGFISIVSTVILAVAFTPSPDSLAPLILSNIFQLSGMIGCTAILFTNVESSLTAVGRLLTLSELPPEKDVVRQRPLDDTQVKDIDSSSQEEAGEEKLKILVDESVDIIVNEENNGNVPDAWPQTGRVEYKHVTAAYTWDAAPALRDLSVSIPHGTSCAFIGRSGSGKSTSVLALTGMIPIISGRIEFDGVEIRDISLRRLREGIAVVPQVAVLFNGSIRYNLDLHNEREDADLWYMLAIVGLKDVVQEAGGLDTVLDPQAAVLSAGQKQLLALCRALLRDKPLLILDEANASVDAETEQAMGLIVKDFSSGKSGITKRNRSVIEIAHRLSNVISMDQVVVLRAGSILEIGRPSELAERTGSEFGSMLIQSGSVPMILKK